MSLHKITLQKRGTSGVKRKIPKVTSSCASAKRLSYFWRSD